MTAIDTAIQEIADPEREVFAHDVAEVEVSAEAAAQHYDDPGHWCAPWLAEQMAIIDDGIVRRKAWLDRELKRIERKREYLLWKWGPIAQNEVFQQTRGKKSRSIDTPSGRVGFRKSGGGEKVVVDDEELAIRHAADKCPDAIKVTRKLLVSELKALPEPLPGTHKETTPKRDRFFVGKHTRDVEDSAALPAPADSPRFDADAFYKELTNGNDQGQAEVAGSDDETTIPVPGL